MQTIKELEEMTINNRTRFQDGELKALKDVLGLIDKCIGYSDYKPNMIVIDVEELKARITG